MRRGDRNDFIVEQACFLCGGSALLARQRIFVLRLAADAIPLRDRLGSLEHGHVDCAVHLHQFRIRHHAHFLGLDETDALLTTGGNHIHAVCDDLLCRGSNAHQAA